MNSLTTEKTFETAIIQSLVENGGYTEGNAPDYSPELGMFKYEVLAFLQETQPKNWRKLSTIHGDDVDNRVIQRLYKEMDLRGSLDVLRNGFVDYGVRFKMAFFKPESGLNPETKKLYEQNRLKVIRQLYYSKKNKNPACRDRGAGRSVDLVLLLNGIPVATFELKNQFTGQTAENAKRQYARTRDNRELLFAFKKRALVHFAVDPDELFMATKIEGKNTYWLPFNKGFNNGKGNPPNPNLSASGGQAGGYKTAYLWEEVLVKDSWMEIIQRFIHLQIDEIEIDLSASGDGQAGGKIIKKEKMIFPRYHQLDSVRKITADAKQAGAGKNYLVQHSAGSGKSNSIAWLAYRLSSLHNSQDERIFDSVIVVTDRRVLDQQLQNTIYQFEHKTGVVQKIDKDSSQLAVAIGSGSNIIITTLQKFPFVIDKVGDLPDRKYAVIIDEAHSSQGGESSKKMKEVLATKPVETHGRASLQQTQSSQPQNDDDYTGEDFIREQVERSATARGQQSNISFFAFTATPKYKTLAVFGHKDINLPAPHPRKGEYCIYVLKCEDNSFYIGQTDNFERRLKQHNNKEVSWTSPRLPVEPVHWEIFDSREKAVKREKDLKTGFGRKWLKREYNAERLRGAARQAGGKPKPFHLYSMRQAIEEGFILDVLQNYVTYELYFKLSKAIEEDPELNKKKAAIAIGRFVNFHPYNLAQKTEVVIEHFRQVVAKKIGGKAKAMFVTSSRMLAKRYFEEFNKYILAKGYEKDIKILVAFSGSVIDDNYPMGVAEPHLTGYSEKELPQVFSKDEYRILIVADKYQTGFDQPMLHTMYVDKQLSGVKAVQTLSRLNRIAPGKDDTFILDFVNDRQTIFASFQPYYEVTTVTEEPEPNHLFDLKTKLDEWQIYWQSEIDSFSNIYFKPSGKLTAKDQSQLYAFIDPAVDRYKAIETEEKKPACALHADRDEFKKSLKTWTNLYAFLAQIMPFKEAEFEKFYAYSKLLQTKLPKRNLSEQLHLDDEIALEYYRLQKIKEGSIDLLKGEAGEINGLTEAGIKRAKEEKAYLSEIIDVLNERFGTEFEDADRLFFEQIETELVQDETLKTQARVNKIDTFKYAFEDLFFSKLVERMDQNQEIFEKILEDKAFGGLVKEWMLKKVYSKLNEEVANS